MKFNLDVLLSLSRSVAPARERGLKSIEQVTTDDYVLTVAPARERGLKYSVRCASPHIICVAPARERGLKYIHHLYSYKIKKVAPARERGLKCKVTNQNRAVRRRSREGAWIEIWTFPTAPSPWLVAPARERGLKSVPARRAHAPLVAPARERGLKYQQLHHHQHHLYRRSREGAWIEMVLANIITDCNPSSLLRGSVD